MAMLVIPAVHAQKPKKQMYTPNAPVDPKFKVDTRIDNMSYWRRMASLGKVPVQQEIRTPQAVYGSSKLIGKGVMTEDSPDVAVTTVTSTQSENSIFVNPQNSESVLQSNNSTQRPVGNLYGANSFLSTNAGTTWGGTVNGAGGTNSGDPATAISLDGRYYVGYIHSNGGQGVSYSTDQGNTWTAVLVKPGPGGWNSLLDKNHMWIDNSPTSPHEGNLYDAWTNIGGNNNNQIEISRSTDGALTWSNAVPISNAVNAGSHNQGVNIQTGPNGEVYVLWAIYDTWPSDEKALGFAKSLDGGLTWLPATRILNNIRGIRTSGTDKNMRVNSFPTMAVDISNGPHRGDIYVTWANIGVPGTNTGNDIDVYMIKSTDDGATWSSPMKVNQDPSGLGKEHYFPWITCDPVNGKLSVIYYDNRNVASNQCEVYTSNSADGGATWWDMKISDVSFTPSPIPGLADGYFGDYLANHARDGWVYPAWTDNRLGYAMTFVSPYVTGPPPNQPWLVFESSSIDDSQGNNNGLMDFGESSLLNVTLENNGDEPAISVNAVLSTDNEYVTITDNTAAFGDIPVNGMVTTLDPFGISVANDIPDSEVVNFTIDATDVNDSTFSLNFTIEAHAPAFKIGNIGLTEIAGNGNNSLNAGESANINVPTINTGDYKAYDVTAILTCSSPYITIVNSTSHWDSIMPGPFNMVNPVFEISVSEDAPEGHFAEFHYQINSQYHQGSKDFRFPVGLIVEDWETGNFTKFPWEFAGSQTWLTTNQIKYEGSYSAVSGDIPNNSFSELKLNYNVMNDDSISFFVKVSSEDDYDFLKFYIDNDLIAQWSGEINWHKVGFPVNAGQQVFRWVYQKDSYDVAGEDAAWIDYIILPELLQTTAYAGPNGTTCENDSYLLTGTANNFVTTHWTTSGDGSFDDASSLTCFYTPGENDKLNGNVVLTLTVNGPAGELKTDNLTLTIATEPVLEPLTDVEVCAGQDLDIVALGSNYTTATWTTSGTGTFSDPAALTTSYQPTAEDYAAGQVTLHLELVSSAACDAASDSIVVVFHQLPTIAMNGTTTICEGQQANLDLTLTGTAPWTLNLSGEVHEIAALPFALQLSPPVTTEYVITSLVDATGCSALNNVDPLTITVNPLPTVTTTADTTLCSINTVTLEAVATGDVSYMWTPGNQSTSFITADNSGVGIGNKVFTVSVTDNLSGCSTEKSITVTFQDCTGLGETVSSDISLYPNPSKGDVSLTVNRKLSGSFVVEIFDMNNKLVYSESSLTQLANGMINLKVTNLADGVYTLYVKDNTQIISTKLIIKK